MAEITINNSPIHSDSMISYPYGVQDSGYTCGWHTGVDFVPYGTTPPNPFLYPVKDGTVVYVNNTTNVALGVQCQIQDNDGYYWRYCHMVLNSLRVRVGDPVTTLMPIGIMGTTGNSTGVHLHLECSTTQNWQCDTFVNPCTLLNIPNDRYTIIHYDGTIPPTPPTPTFGNANKWLKAKSKKYNINY